MEAAPIQEVLRETGVQELPSPPHDTLVQWEQVSQGQVPLPPPVSAVVQVRSSPAPGTGPAKVPLQLVQSPQLAVVQTAGGAVQVQTKTTVERPHTYTSVLQGSREDMFARRRGGIQRSR